MNKKISLVAVLTVSILTLYLVTTLVKADNPIGKFVSVKGGEIEDFDDGQWATHQPEIQDLNLAWARIHARWYLMDREGKGPFDFANNDEYKDFRDAVDIANNMGAEVIVTIKGSPLKLIDPTPIATATNGAPTPWPFPCGRISTPDGVNRLESFIVALIQQLRTDLWSSEPPPVLYIELWNEPDVPALNAVPIYYGCWVNNYDGTAKFEIGGAYYAQVLNAIAPDVKSQFPPGSIKFVGGAAMIPDNGFLETVIGTAIPNIDVVSYHHYVFTNNSNCDLPTYIANYETSFSEVRNYLDNNGGTAIPILISEGAMGYSYISTATPPAPTETPALAFYNCQANFAANLLAWAEVKRNSGNLLGFIWYTIAINNWAETDLLYLNGTPKPVYYVWRDFSPSLYLPLLYSNGGGMQGSLMNGVAPVVGTDVPANPYPPP